MTVYFPSTLDKANNTRKLFVLLAQDKGFSLNPDHSLNSWPTWFEGCKKVPKKNCTVHILERDDDLHGSFSRDVKLKSFLLSHSGLEHQLSLLSNILLLLEKEATAEENFRHSLSDLPKKIKSKRDWTALRELFSVHQSKGG